MSKIQTRKSVSISGATYTRFKAYCRKNKETMSGVVEDLLHQLLNPDQPLVIEKVGRLAAPTPFVSKFPNIPAAKPVDQEPSGRRAVQKLLDARDDGQTSAKEPDKFSKGSKPPEMDEVTKAVRKVQDIFTF
jgi:hypothetical protein